MQSCSVSQQNNALLTEIADSRISTSIKIEGDAIHLPDDIVGAWMAHPEPEVRLAGMFLSVYSTAITKPITGAVFKSLRRNLPHLHTDTDANFRREIHGYTQKLFDRLRASTATLVKGKSKAATSSSDRLPFPRNCASKSSRQDPLTESLEFVVWYIRFLQWEMRPTASYQRRVTALRSINIVLRSGVDSGVPFSQLSKSAQGQLNWAHGLQIANEKLLRVLIDLIMDPFDDIRDAAVSVVQLCLVALSKDRKEAAIISIENFARRAEAIMLRTGRADQADGVARTGGLVFSLKEAEGKYTVFQTLQRQLQITLLTAHTNLSKAVDGHPIHGTFATLRYIVDQDDFYSILTNTSSEEYKNWNKSHSDIITCIESLWNCVYHVLCADAPEGYVPDELEEEASLDTKEVLSYSWRGVKEAR